MSDWDDQFKDFQQNMKLDEMNRNLQDIKRNQDIDRMQRNFDRLNRYGAQGYGGGDIPRPIVVLMVDSIFITPLIVAGANGYSLCYLFATLIFAISVFWLIKKELEELESMDKKKITDYKAKQAEIKKNKIDEYRAKRAKEKSKEEQACTILSEVINLIHVSPYIQLWIISDIAERVKQIKQLGFEDKVKKIEVEGKNLCDYCISIKKYNIAKFFYNQGIKPKNLEDISRLDEYIPVKVKSDKVNGISFTKLMYDKSYEIFKKAKDSGTVLEGNEDRIRDHLIRTILLDYHDFEPLKILFPLSKIKNSRFDLIIFPKHKIESNFEAIVNLSKEQKTKYFNQLDEEVLKLLNGDNDTTEKVFHIAEAVLKKKLDGIIGQAKAKQMLDELFSLVKVNKERIKNGMNAQSVNLHTIFSGSPGTGKTTIARIYADFVKSLGLLSKGHLVEVSRNDLVAAYVGQTAIKTTEKFNEAKGGILFIDEAYSLKTGENDNYGTECIDTLVKLIEDNRNDIVVILAGYEEEMREFLRHNTGLKSRIPNQIAFEDFKNDELKQIIISMFESKGLKLEEHQTELALNEVLKKKKGGALRKCKRG